MRMNGRRHSQTKHKHQKGSHTSRRSAVSTTYKNAGSKTLARIAATFQRDGAGMLCMQQHHLDRSPSACASSGPKACQHLAYLQEWQKQPHHHHHCCIPVEGDDERITPSGSCRHATELQLVRTNSVGSIGESKPTVLVSGLHIRFHVDVAPGAKQHAPATDSSVSTDRIQSKAGPPAAACGICF